MVLLVGIVLGSMLVGAIAGVGIDYVAGNQGWWGGGLLVGLMTAGVIDATVVERLTAARR